MNQKSFGDDRVFIEKYIEEPRHIEIQILCDKHGNQLHLGERECSIQRRYQKVIEECPSPFVDEEMREEMARQALTLAKEVRYDSAGTVEFVVDKNKNFYFLEMNTRLQVEHPVTELVTNVDLVEQMIRCADNQKLNIKQKDIKLNGWSVESRIYAEDPTKDFLPSIGRVSEYIEPNITNSSSQIVRNDTGISPGSDISIYYDPMISKLAVHSNDRKSAIKLMIESLNQYYLSGVGNNIEFLISILSDKKFQKGDISTNFIKEKFKNGYQANCLIDQEKIEKLSLSAIIIHLSQIKNPKTMINKDFTISSENKITNLKILNFNLQNNDLSVSVQINKKKYELSTDWKLYEKILRLSIDNDVKSFKVVKIKSIHDVKVGFEDCVWI